jgi:hypothetical protein
VLVVSHLPEREPVTPEVPAAAVLRVEPLRVEPVDAAQRVRERLAGAFDDEVVVVRHQAEGVNVESKAGDRAPELREELTAVVAVEVDLPALDPAGRDVPDAVLGERGSRQARHRTSVGASGARIGSVDKLAQNCFWRWDMSGDSPRTRPT